MIKAVPSSGRIAVLDQCGDDGLSGQFADEDLVWLAALGQTNVGETLEVPHWIPLFLGPTGRLPHDPGGNTQGRIAKDQHGIGSSHGNGVDPT